MNFTAPQKLLLETVAPTLNDYVEAIRRRPGALEHYVEQAKKAGFSSADLKSLFGQALREKLININDYRFHVGKLDLQRDRTQRKTGRLDPRETALSSDDEEEYRTVVCARCKKSSKATDARLRSVGWLCNACLGRPATGSSPPKSEITTTKLSPGSELDTLKMSPSRASGVKPLEV